MNFAVMSRHVIVVAVAGLDYTRTINKVKARASLTFDVRIKS